jgi:hypothetical protein
MRFNDYSFARVSMALVLQPLFGAVNSLKALLVDSASSTLNSAVCAAVKALSFSALNNLFRLQLAQHAFLGLRRV